MKRRAGNSAPFFMVYRVLWTPDAEHQPRKPHKQKKTSCRNAAKRSNARSSALPKG